MRRVSPRAPSLARVTAASRRTTGSRPRPPRPPAPLAGHLPVARVAVDTGLAHLDRPFDYSVPASMEDTAQPGCRVRVRFAGRLVDGWVLERAESTDHAGALASIASLVS